MIIIMNHDYDDALDDFKIYLNKETSEFLPWSQEFIQKDIMTYMERKLLALEYISRFGQIEGDHHSKWVIDQVARVLTGSYYEEWIKEICHGEDGPNTYEWNAGIAP